MKHYLTIGILCLAATAALADQLVDARGLPYDGSITNYRSRILSLRTTATRREKNCPLDQVRSLKIDDFQAFNQAEALVAKKKYAEAISEYDKAMRSAPKNLTWVQSLVSDRRYQALAKAGKIDQAMSDWLKMMDADPNDKIVQGLMPDTFAPKGDPANAAALKLLNAKLAELKGNSKAEDYTRRLLKLKMKLLDAMGEEEKATAAAEAVTQLDTPAAPAEGETAAKDTAPKAPPAANDLDVLARLVEAGKYDEVIEKLAPRLQTLPKRQLPKPLLLLAKAQWLQYRNTEPKDQKLLLRTGLNLMWVYSAFGNSDEAPEALFLAAEVHKAMGNPDAARRALVELVDQFGGAEDNAWVVKAQEALENETKTE